ncbi:MAG: DNA-processing protein DprA [bacterium]
MRNTSEALIGLNMIRGIPSYKLNLLLKNLADPFSASYSSLKEIIEEEWADLICKERKKIDIKKEIKLAKENGIRIIVVEDEEYPESLKLISDPPIVLYIKGKIIPDDKLSIAIVGSRHSSSYGRNVCEMLGRELSKLGFTIVSGMARGIDTIAHRACLEAKGRTIAVLGSGLLNVYPSENKPLFEKICENGAVISEFPLDTPPFKDNFPRRNRIIAGLSLGCVVVEAKERSGALITARLAMESGREVFAVPGEITKETSKGTNKLIKEGVKPVCDVLDIIEELGHIVEIK